jgi:malonate transporter and related proteins
MGGDKVDPVSKIIIPFFGLIFFGYVAARRNWVPPASVPAFNGFLLYFAVPALLFRFASTAAFTEIMNGRFFVAYSLAGLVTLLCVIAFARGVMRARLRDASFYGLAASATNVGYLAIPLLVALLGASAASPAMLATVAEMTIVASVAVALSQLDGTRSTGWRKAATDAMARAAGNPFVISIAVGAAFSALHWKLPTPIDEIMNLLANAAGPCALFAIGVSLYRPGATQGVALIALPVVGKLLLHPLLVWLALLAFGLDRFTIAAGVLTAALPTAGWVFIFAQRYESDVARISTALVASTALSAITFSALVWYLGLGMPAK